MTFSISGRCKRTGAFGVAVTTSSIAVAARCPFARANVGAVSTQNVTNPAIGPRGLDLMAQGMSAKTALERIVRHEPFPDFRQIAFIGKSGPPAFYEGAKTLGTHAGHTGADSVGIGNLLANTDVPRAMVETFEAHPDLFIAERLMRALEEGLVAGGELGAVKSAGLYVVTEYPWPVCDLRVDWAEEGPIAKLRELWTLYEPQMEMYQIRAVNPTSAASYGVPGDP